METTEFLKTLKYDSLLQRAHIMTLGALVKQMYLLTGAKEHDYDETYKEMLFKQIDIIEAADPFYDKAWKEKLKNDLGL